MHERECKGYISFNRGVNELNRGVNELNRGVNELNRGVNHSVARQGCNLLRAAVTSAVTSQGCCCGNLQIHPLDLGHGLSASTLGTVILSLIIPLVMFVVSLVVKKYVKEVRSTTFEEYLPINEEQEARESQSLLKDSPV